MQRILHSVPRLKQTFRACGPYALAQLLTYFGKALDPSILATKIGIDSSFGVSDADLGLAALLLGFKVRLSPLNLNIFDPTWMALSQKNLCNKLSRSLKFEKDSVTRHWIEGYIKYMDEGGIISLTSLSRELILKKLEQGPLLIGLCSTYLYKEPRYDFKKRQSADLFGKRKGHFVVVAGYEPNRDCFDIVDPYPNIPNSKNGRYKVSSEHLMNSMFLAEATHDCSILEITGNAA